MKKIRIGNKLVGEGKPCFIIGEIGSNHDRKLEQAKRLIDIAKEAGTDAVKFQVYSAEKLYSQKTPIFPYENEPPYQVALKTELPREWQPELANYASSKGIIFLSTPFDYQAIDELSQIGVPAYKWSSSEITDLPLLKYAAGKGKPMLISTGMSNLADIQEAIDAVYTAGNDDIALLHCTSLYPTKPNQTNLRMMDTLKAAFQVPVGFSDHTLGVAITLAAVSRGACIIEKHFTLSRKLEGPDHPYALEPDKLKEMVKLIREVEVSLGSPIKSAIAEEMKKIQLSRRSVIAKVNIPKGTKLTKDLFVIKRPGYGIQPKFISLLIGRETKCDIEKDSPITWEMIR